MKAVGLAPECHYFYFRCVSFFLRSTSGGEAEFRTWGASLTAISRASVGYSESCDFMRTI
jgi:hypothetical protein